MIGCGHATLVLVFVSCTWQRTSGLQSYTPSKSLALSESPPVNDWADVPEGGIQWLADSGPWKPVAQQEADVGTRNLCGGGKQLPDLYVLGVQKCGTSSLAKALMGAGINNVHSAENAKELHFFNMPIKVDYSLEWQEDTGSNWQDKKPDFLKEIKWDGLGLNENRELWYDYNMPACPNAADAKHLPKRSVLADFTPDYVRIVPHPQELGKPDDGWRPIDEMNVSLPKFLRKMYGEAPSAKLNFAVLLRDPMAQMQSAWYMAEASGFVYCRGCKGDSFQSTLKDHLERAVQVGSKRELSLWLWTVFYARQIEDWLVHYDASQFFIIPMRELAKDDTKAICNEFSKRLAFDMDCNVGPQEKTWGGKHPALADDINPNLVASFNEVMGAESDRLVTLLTKAHGDGMSLANYNGAKGDEKAVKEWLMAGW